MLSVHISLKLSTPLPILDLVSKLESFSYMYICSFVLTVFFITLVALAGYALYNIYKHKHDTHFIFVALGFLTVGVGSWMFHMSLLYEYQLLDELPMIYATCVPYWIVFSHGRNQSGSRRVAAQITAAALILTAIYLHYRDPTIHQAAYGILNLIIIIKCYLLSKSECSDPIARKKITLLGLSGIASFVVGWLLWNIDIHLCSFWRFTRREIGMPWGFFLEGHGWWHLLTGYGVYFCVVYLEYLGLYLKHNGEEKFYELKWTFGILPHLDLKPGVIFDKSSFSSPRAENASLNIETNDDRSNNARPFSEKTQ